MAASEWSKVVRGVMLGIMFCGTVDLIACSLSSFQALDVQTAMYSGCLLKDMCKTWLLVSERKAARMALVIWLR